MVAEVEPSVMIWQKAVEGDLWQPVVWRYSRESSHFVGVEIQACLVAITTIGEGTALVDHIPTFNTNLTGFQIRK